MQNPSASDPSFKAFLEKLQEQNNRGFATQLVQLKAEREIAGEDGDKREEQLDKANENLKNLKDETTSVGDNLKSSLQDLSDDTIEVQDQLDTANDSLSEIATAIIGARESIEVEMLAALEGIKEAVTGIKLDVDFSELKTAIENVGYDVGKDIDSGHLVATIGAIGANTTKLLDEQLKELSLTRKLTEGSVEYDKEAAQYRNKSGRDVESKVSGKTSKDGGFIDFETARDTLSGQGERARKENKVSLISSLTTTRSGIKPGDATAKSLGADLGSSGPVDAAEPVAKTPEEVQDKSTQVVPSRNTSIKRARRERDSVTGNVGAKNKKEDEEGVDNFDPSLLGRLKSFMTDGESDKPGYGLFQKPPKEVEKKEREAKVSSSRQENPEADNITSTGEIQADAAKSDLELSKQMLDTTREQLIELRAIREALAPSTPKELTEQKGAPSSTTEKEKEGGGSLLGDLASGATDLMGSKGKLGKMGGRLMTAGKAALPYAAAAGVAVAGGAAVDYGLGKLGVGKDKEGNDLQVNTAQDDANWAKMSMGQKIESGFARGIEKTGSALFLGNVSKEAQATRIKKETEYLNKNAPGTATKEALAGKVVGESGSDDDSIYSRTIMKLKGYDPDAPDEVKAFKRLTADNRPLTSIPNIVSGSATGSILGDIDQVFATKSKNNITGSEVAKTSTENADMTREASGKGANNTVVSNNVSSNNTTKIVPMKASPRPEYTGSSLDRYTNRITVY